MFDTTLTKRKAMQDNFRFTPPSNRVSYSDFEYTYFDGFRLIHIEIWKPDTFTRISELVFDLSNLNNFSMILIDLKTTYFDVLKLLIRNLKLLIRNLKYKHVKNKSVTWQAR